MQVGVHPVVQNSDDFHPERIGFPKEDYMGALREFPVALPNFINALGNLGGIGKAGEYLEKFTNVDISLAPSPLLFGIGGDTSQIRVRLGGKPESGHTL